MDTDHPSSIKDWPEDERPRERLVRYGADKLSDAQLLGILIGSGDARTRKNAVDLSRDLLKKFEDFQSIDSASVNELCSVPGVGMAKAAQIKAALELGKRMASKKSGSKQKMNTSRALVDHYAPYLKNLKKEVVKVVLLNPKLHIIKDITTKSSTGRKSTIRTTTKIIRSGIASTDIVPGVTSSWKRSGKTRRVSRS